MSRKGHITAKQIYQELLDRLSEAYMREDFDYFRSMIHTPHEFVTKSGETILNDDEGLHRAFITFRRYMDSQGMTDFVRTSKSARFVSETEIEGTHVSHLVCGTKWIEEPYLVMSQLKVIDGIWKVYASYHEINDKSWTARSVKAGAAQPKGEDHAQD